MAQKRSLIDTLRRKIIVFTALGVMIVCLLVAMVTGLPLYHLHARTQSQKMVFAQNTQALLVSHFLGRVKDVAVQITSRTNARHLLRDYNLKRISRAQLVQATKPLLIDPLQQSDLIEGIVRLDASGAVVVVIGRLIPKSHWPDVHTINRPVISGPLTLGQTRYLLVAAPIIDSTAEKVGTDLVLFRTDMLENIIAHPLELGKTAWVLIGARIGDTVGTFFPLPELWRTRQREIESIMRSSVQHNQSGLTVSATISPEITIAYGPAENSDWSVLVVMASSELQASVAQDMAIILSLAIILAVLGGLSMVLILKPLTGRIVMRTDELENAIQDRVKDLKQAKEAAQAANHAKSQFLANMSHEIRTPMNAILGYAQILRNSEMNQDQRHGVDTIECSGNHLLGLINDILDLSKIEAGAMELHCVDFDLESLMHGISDMFILRCEQKCLRWRVIVDLQHKNVHGDQNKLRQVLINLLGNAIKFTQQGEIKLSVQHQGDNAYRFAVEDTGMGIPQTRQATIFDPFHQEQEGMTKGGTGLGLSISQRHIALMHGNLQLTSEAGRGACFYFVIQLPPAQGEVASRADRTARYVRVKHNRMIRALVIDDNPDNRDILQQILFEAGLDVAVADDDEQALAHMTGQCPDIVFLDVRLSIGAGVKALNRIHASRSKTYARTCSGWDNAHDFKCVAVSASSFWDDREQYLRAGFDDFIAKPYRFESVYECIKQSLGVEFERVDNAAASTYAMRDNHCTVPDALTYRFNQALELGQVTELSKLIENIKTLSDEGQAVGERLSDILAKLDLDGLKQAFENMTGAA